MPHTSPAVPLAAAIDAAMAAAAAQDGEAFHTAVEQVLDHDHALPEVWKRLAATDVPLTGEQVHEFATGWLDDCPASDTTWMLHLTDPNADHPIGPIPDNLHPICTGLLCLAAAT